jgi:hypothetical protein
MSSKGEVDETLVCEICGQRNEGKGIASHCPIPDSGPDTSVPISGLGCFG